MVTKSHCPAQMRPRISPPYFPTHVHSKIPYAPSSPSSLTSEDLQSRATTIINLLGDARDHTELSLLIAPHARMQHNEDPPSSREAFIYTWRKIAASVGPGFGMRIKEAAVDERQRKVWVLSEITGVQRVPGVVKESVDMMHFDEQGLLIESMDYTRLRRVDGPE